MVLSYSCATRLTLVFAVIMFGGCRRAGEQPRAEQKPFDKPLPNGSAKATPKNASPPFWTVLNQQPVGVEFYPHSVWTTPLPTTGSFAVQNHLLTNSDAIIKNVFANSDTPSGYVPSVTATTPGGDTACNKSNIYYSSQSDPVYFVKSCTNVPSQAVNNPNGKYFHLPKGAQFSCTVASDHGLTVWDQSLDLDPTPGGRGLSLYAGVGAGLVTLSTSCTCTTTACALSTPACWVSYEYCNVNYPFADVQGGIGDGAAWNSMNAGSLSALTRWEEVCGGFTCPGGGRINHAMTADTACTHGVSFPSVGYGSLDCANDSSVASDTNVPANGALFWIDSAYNCNALPPWQKPVCVAAQTYGYYIRDTSSGPYAGTYLMNFESQVALHDAGQSDPTPFLNYISGFNSPLVACSGWPVTRCNIGFLVGMPGLITGDSGNGFRPHLHVVDPCIPRSMAGQSATCTGSPSD